MIVDSSDERGQADRRAFMLVLGICSIIGPCDSVKETERERELASPGAELPKPNSIHDCLPRVSTLQPHTCFQRVT